MRTQKAKGIAALRDYSGSLLFNDTVAPLPFALISEVDDVVRLAEWPGWPGVKLFGRCCPPNPEHGFVDSRPIHSNRDAVELLLMSQAIHSDSELIVMPYIDASHNIVWTKGKLTVGSGHDGATSGKDCVSIATTSRLPFSDDSLVEASGIAAGSVPYLEFVRPKASKYDWHIVQVRGGPSVADLGDDYLPGPMQCQRVIEARGDLIEWKEIVESLQPGDFVYHSPGSLATHYGVHSVMKKIPIFTTRRPEVGKTYEVCSCKPPAPDGDWCAKCGAYCGKKAVMDVDEAIKGLSYGMVLNLSKKSTFPYEDAVKMLLGANHNVVFFGKKESRLFGVAVALTVRLALMACFGEARHKSYTGLTRQQIYEQAWKETGEYVKRFNEARIKFYQGGWRSGFGGKAWAMCADATANLWNATVQFVLSKKPEDLDRLVDCLNVTVNCAHNNCKPGQWFDKFIDRRWFDIAVQSPASPLISVAHIIYDMMRADIKVDGLVRQIETAAGSERKQVEIRYRGKKHTISQEAGGYSFDGNHYGQLKDAVLALVKTINTTRTRPLTDRFIRRNVTSSPEVIEWIIQEIHKEQLHGRKVRAARGRLRDSILHMQVEFEGQGGYESIDKQLKLAEVNLVAQWVAGQPKVKSMASTDHEYVMLHVRPDGIYASGVNVKPLSKGKEVQ